MDSQPPMSLPWAGDAHELQFGFSSGKKAKWMVNRRNTSAASMSTSAMGAAPASLFPAPKQRRAAAFASVSASSSASGKQDAAGAKMPLFMLASASEPKKQQPASNAPAWRVAVGNLAAGATAGCAVEAALYPLDTIKTRLQAMIGGGGIKALLESGGGRGLYAGVWGNLLGVAPASAIFISVYEPVKKAVEEQVSAEKQYLGAVLAGMAAGTASSLVRVPTEVVKQRLQTKEFATAAGAIGSIMSREGVRGMYAGYGAFMLRDLPFDAIEFVAYEQMKVAAQKYLGRKELQPQETSVIGAIAGGFTGLVTTPLDVLKTRLMVQGASGRYKNLFDATYQIARDEGLTAFLKGWQPRLIWISMGGFVFFPVLEAAKKYFALAPAPEPTPAPVVEEKGKKGKK